ncbi:MAG TPA: T9SS type A sorting domain-containing protein, partial [Chitinophagales bacterium]|nr:T9SS type A sorting domain-containing protein [Chitinophagales bacterium]
MKMIIHLRAALCVALISFLSFAGLNAQYVTIPDAAFVTWLQNNGFAGCISGNQLDTTCSAVQTASTLNCSSVPIRNLSGVQYFRNLDYLFCGDDSLYTIPALPPNLKTLNCLENNLSSLPVLPSSLLEINCSYNPLTGGLPTLPNSVNTITCAYNGLTSLPTLPSSLMQIDCDNNRLTSLPSLPAGLSILNCSYNALTSLPNIPAAMEDLNANYNNLSSIPTLPQGITELDCDSNHLSVLPALPASLQTLFCGLNNLSALPALPAALNTLSCNNNHISTIPALPAGLNYIRCDNNTVAALPALPLALQSLICGSNQISTLPTLPAGLTDLRADNNLLSALPVLPDSLEWFDVSNNANITCLPQLKRIVNCAFTGTGVTCLPDYGMVTYSTPALNTLPLCGIYNPTGCSTFWNISGQCYYDQNSNCSFDNVDAGSGYVKTMLYQNGTLQQQAYSGTEGFYSFQAAYGNYTLQVDTTILPFTLNCPDSGYLNTTISAADSLSYSNNFAFKCRTQGFDIGVHSILNNYTIPRPNNTIIINTIAGDLSQLYGAHCATGISGTVSLTYTGPVTYTGPAGGSLTPTTVNGNTLTWNIPDFGSLDIYNSFNVQLRVDSLSNTGAQVCINVSLTPTAADYNTSNNSAAYCLTIVNSEDPNEKEVYPSDTINTAQPWLTYTVRFQNTGTAPALNILVADTLDSHLDPSTFQLLAYSHKNLTQITGNIVQFDFPNINLPDSTADEPNSHGYVQYKIKLKNNLPVGTTINNTAYIYFDFNSPVVTNTTTNTITTTTGITPLSPGEGLGVRIYPNPAKDAVTVEVDNTAIGGTLQLTDVTGRAIITSQIESRTSHIATSFLSSG